MNLFVVKCFICKDSDEVNNLEEDDLVDLPLHMTYVHASEGLEIEALCDTCDFMFDASKGKFNAHMKNIHNRNVNNKILSSALMQGKIRVWSSETIKSENEEEGKFVSTFAREIDTKKIILRFICPSCGDSIIDNDLQAHEQFSTCANSDDRDVEIIEEEIELIDVHADGNENGNSDDEDVEEIEYICPSCGESILDKELQAHEEFCAYENDNIDDEDVEEIEEEIELLVEEIDEIRKQRINVHELDDEDVEEIDDERINVHEHESAKTFTCGKCNYSTLHKTDLKRHRTTIHDRENAETFPCGECNYST